MTVSLLIRPRLHSQDYSSFSGAKTSQAGNATADFRICKWKPPTRWDGYQVLEEKGFQFVLLKYLVCGCHCIPTFEKNEGRYYLNDFVDGDAFIRFYLNKRF